MGIHKRPEHVARNPFGTLPVLSRDGNYIRESRAIIDYLEDAFPDETLFSPDMQIRAMQRDMEHGRASGRMSRRLGACL